MVSQRLKKIIDFEEAFWDAKAVKEATEIYTKLFDERLITNSPLGRYNGYHSLQNIYLDWLAGFPNIKLFNTKFREIDNMVFWEWDSTCKHEGRFHGIEPTGKQASYIGKTIYRFYGDTIINYICYVDMSSIYQQLGFFLQREEYDGQSIMKQNYSLLIAKLIELTQYNGVKLTAKELEILSCWFFGHSLKAIAALFNISPRTVEAHIEHIKYKLLCHSKYDLQNLIHSKRIDILFQDLYFLVVKRTRKSIDGLC